MYALYLFVLWSGPAVYQSSVFAGVLGNSIAGPELQILSLLVEFTVVACSFVPRPVARCYKQVGVRQSIALTRGSE